MHDFTIEYHQQCIPPVVITSRNGKYEIRGLGSERHDPTCTCPAFKYAKGTSKTCKHIREAEEDMCGWHSMFSPEVQTEEQKKDQICPKCGKSTEIVRVAV